MTTYQKFRKLNIDFSAIGLEVTGTEEPYFCTPKGARIIGSAGVDGIHYCFVRGQGEMVFAVRPMNETGKNVFPIARNFEDLLRLLAACGSMDAIEQAWQWDEEQFDEYLAEYPAKSEALAVSGILRDKLGITPMKRPFEYLCELQRSYNYGELNFTTEYYELLHSMPAERIPSEWKVTMDGGFCPERGKNGKCITVNQDFIWGDDVWHVPAVYVCSTGLVVDFCIEVGKDDTDIGFRGDIILNGETLPVSRGSNLTYVPSHLRGDDDWEEPETIWVMEHYNLDSSKSWVIRRCTFPWEGRRSVEPETLKLKLERDRTEIPGMQFQTPEVGEQIKFKHPVTGEEHILTVREYEAQELDPDCFNDENIEFPRQLSAMVYTLEPDLSGIRFMLQDCDPGDRPRVKSSEARMASMMFFGCKAAARIRNDGTEKTHAACSSAHFEPIREPVQWKMVFYEKMMEDMEIELIRLA